MGCERFMMKMMGVSFLLGYLEKATFRGRERRGGGVGEVVI